MALKQNRMTWKLFAIGFVITWIWIAYELLTAPEYDENENPIEKK